MVNLKEKINNIYITPEEFLNKKKIESYPGGQISYTVSLDDAIEAINMARKETVDIINKDDNSVVTNCETVAYIARDKSGMLGCYSSKPIKGYESWYVNDIRDFMCFIYSEKFKEVKWEDEDPKELIIKM